MQLTFDIAERYEIPIIIAGWTKGQSSKQTVMSKCGCNTNQPEFARMAGNTRMFLESFLKDHPRYKNFPKSMEDVLVRAKKKHKSVVLSPHWFLPIDSDKYIELIQKELKWNFPRYSYPAKTTNCYLNFISVHNSMKYYGYTHYHVEASKLIRDGLMSREEALNDLKINFDLDFLNKISVKLNYQFQE